MRQNRAVRESRRTRQVDEAEVSFFQSPRCAPFLLIPRRRLGHTQDRHKKPLKKPQLVNGRGVGECDRGQGSGRGRRHGLAAGGHQQGLRRDTRLSEIDLTIDAGDVVGLMGDNGAGKSTLVKIIAGNFHPTHGLLRFDGQNAPIRPAARRAKRRHRGRLPGSRARQQRQRRDEVFLGREMTRRSVLSNSSTIGGRTRARSNCSAS